jgi:hypothetical protein
VLEGFIVLEFLLRFDRPRWFDSELARLYNAAFFQNLSERISHVVYISAAVEPQKETRTRIS